MAEFKAKFDQTWYFQSASQNTGIRHKWNSRSHAKMAVMLTSMNARK